MKTAIIAAILLTSSIANAMDMVEVGDRMRLLSCHTRLPAAVGFLKKAYKAQIKCQATEGQDCTGFEGIINSATYIVAEAALACSPSLD